MQVSGKLRQGGRPQLANGVERRLFVARVAQRGWGLAALHALRFAAACSLRAQRPLQFLRIPLERHFFKAEIAPAEFERGLILLVAAIETEGAIDHAALGRAAQDVVDGVGVERRARALAVVVYEQDGGAVTRRHPLQRAVEVGHLLRVHLVEATGGAADGVDDKQLVAEVKGRPDYLQAAPGEGFPVHGKVAIRGWVFGADVDVDVARSHQLLDAAGQPLFGVLKRQVEDACARNFAPEQLAATVNGNGDLQCQVGLAQLGPPGQHSQPDRNQPGDDKLCRGEVGVQHSRQRVGWVG